MKMDEIMVCKRIKYAGDVYKALLELEWDMDTAEAFLDSIPDVPITEYAPVVHGRWVTTLYTTTSKRGRVISNRKFSCSECGYGNGRKQTKYCPNCGAIMDGEDRDDG